MTKPSMFDVKAALCSLAFCLLVPIASASTIDAINHTHWAINRFSVDGRSGIDIIGPYQGGGGGCCYIAQQRWQPGMTVRVDWETGVAYADDSPGYLDWPKYLAWEKKLTRKNAAIARRSRSRTTPARKSAASPCISCLATNCRSVRPATPLAAPNTRSRPLCICRSRSHARGKTRATHGAFQRDCLACTSRQRQHHRRH